MADSQHLKHQLDNHLFAMHEKYQPIILDRPGLPIRSIKNPRHYANIRPKLGTLNQKTRISFHRIFLSSSKIITDGSARNALATRINSTTDNLL